MDCGWADPGRGLDVCHAADGAGCQLDCSVREGAAIIGSMLTFAGTAAVVVGGMLVIFQVWTTALAKGSVTPIVKSSPSAYQAR